MGRFAALLLTFLLAFGCSERELRGTSTPSKDGKTYLVVLDDNGGKCGPPFVDGQEWKFAINEPGEITPGRPRNPLWFKRRCSIPGESSLQLSLRLLGTVAASVV